MEDLLDAQPLALQALVSALSQYVNQNGRLSSRLDKVLAAVQEHTSQLKVRSLVPTLLTCRRLNIKHIQALWKAVNIAAGQVAAKLDAKELDIDLNVTSMVGVYNEAVVERLSLCAM